MADGRWRMAVGVIPNRPDEFSLSALIGPTSVGPRPWIESGGGPTEVGPTRPFNDPSSRRGQDGRSSAVDLRTRAHLPSAILPSVILHLLTGCHLSRPTPDGYTGHGLSTACRLG